MQFNERLKELRKANGMTQEALARASGLSLSSVTKLEQNDMDPAWSTVKALARALGVTTDAFDELPPVVEDEPKAALKRKGKK